MNPRLARLAALLRTLVWIAIMLLLLLPSLNWFGARLGVAAEMGLRDRAVAWALAIPPFAVVALGLSQLLGFCRRLRDRGVFTATAATALGRMGAALMAGSALLPLSRAALGLYTRPPGLSVHDAIIGRAATLLEMAFIGVMLGLVFVAFAAVLREATRLAEENASFV